MPDRLVVDLDDDGHARVSSWPDGGMPEQVSQAPLTWPLDADALEDLRWYLEDYLQGPYGVWEERGPAIREKLAGWGDLVFESVFGPGKARDAYQRARDRNLELVFRSADPGMLGRPWELMRDGAGPVAMRTGGISRSLPVADGAGTLDVPGGNLRVLMVISRPAGTRDVSYQMVARRLLERLDAVRGEVSLTVPRPPTFDTLRDAVRQAAEAGEPFHVVHFDGHGVMPGRTAGGGSVAGRPAMMAGSVEGVLAFEKPGGGSDLIKASQVAQVLADGKVPVVVLNACQSGAVGKELEASVAAALLKAGCAAVVAMAYSVYAVAAAEFMAAFYESLFAGESVGQAVTVGRKRLFEQDDRPSLKGDLPLADWLVPVHYLRREVRFTDARTARPAAAPSLDDALDKFRAAPSEAAAVQDPLTAVDGVFVGRDDLFYQLEAAVRLQRVVPLTGPGGTGKTELAKGFARWWRDTGGVSDSRLVFWHSFEPGVASFGLDGVITDLGLAVFGADFARLDPAERLETVKQLLAQYRVLLVWDNFETVREMPDPTGATPPLDDASCATLNGFLGWVRDHSSSTVLVTSRAKEDWLGQVRRIGVGGLNLPEAAQYAGHLLEPYPDSIIRALDEYWDARGLSAEAAAWAGRVLATTAGPGQAPAQPARSLWLYTTVQQATRQKDAGQPDQATLAYRRALAYLHGQPATDWTRGSISVIDHRLGLTAQDRGRLDEAQDWYRQSLAISEELGNRPGMAITYHQLGLTAQDRGRLDEAQDWYRKSLGIKEDLGNRPGMALTYAQLGLLAEARAQAPLALTWNIRCVTLFDEFPSPLTGTGPSALARLTRQLGLPALEEAWRQVTGQPVPGQVRDYITSHQDQDEDPEASA